MGANPLRLAGAAAGVNGRLLRQQVDERRGAVVPPGKHGDPPEDRLGRLGPAGAGRGRRHSLRFRNCAAADLSASDAADCNPSTLALKAGSARVRA